MHDRHAATDRLALGCWAFGAPEFWGEQRERDSLDTVHAALELGVTWFDTAFAYGDGRSEAVLGRALEDRAGASVATKAPLKFPDPETLIRSGEEAAERLRREAIDLFQLHWWNPRVPLDETFDALRALVDRGRVREVGVCNCGPRQLAQVVQEARRVGLRLRSDQVPYSLLWRAPEDELLSAAGAAGVEVHAYSPLAQGLLTGKFAHADEVPDGRARTRHFSGERPYAGHGEPGVEAETFAAIEALRELARQADVPMHGLALAWLLRNGAVSRVIVGARRPHQLEDTVHAATLDPGDDALQAATDATNALKRALGPNADMWRGEGRLW